MIDIAGKKVLPFHGIFLNVLRFFFQKAAVLLVNCDICVSSCVLLLGIKGISIKTAIWCDFRSAVLTEEKKAAHDSPWPLCLTFLLLCMLLTRVSDLVWELNWGIHSADKQPFYKKPKPLQTEKLGSFLDQFLSLVFQVVTDDVSPTAKQKEGYRLVSERGLVCPSCAHHSGWSCQKPLLSISI